MKVYTNLQINFSIEDHDSIEQTYETYIYTQNGIYKKYKKHFFLCDYDCGVLKTKKVNYKFKEYFIEENDLKLNKKKILTSIPYQCYFVNRFVRKCFLDNDIVFVKEVDNDHFDSCYFLINNISQLEDIGSYVK
jgi:hypothetical protein